MNWTTSPEKIKCWNKAYREYSLESGFPLEDLIKWIKINPFVAVAIENRAIEFLNKLKELSNEKN